MLTLTQFKKLMAVLELSFEELTKTTQQFSELFDDFDGVPKGMARVEDALVDTLDELMGGKGWIQWYVYDCFFGTVPMECNVNGQMVTITDLDTLYAIIISDQGDSTSVD